MDLSGVIGDTAKVFIHRLRQVYDQKEALKEFRQSVKQDFGKITEIINKIKQDFETFYQKDQEAVFKGAPIIITAGLDEFMELLDYDPADEIDELLEIRAQNLVNKTKEIDDEYENILVEMKTLADKNMASLVSTGI